MRRSGPEGRSDAHADQSNRHHGTRPAEDYADQLVEAGRFAEAAEHLLLGSLLDGNGIAEAAEGAVLLIGRVRTFVAMALVREAMPV